MPEAHDVWDDSAGGAVGAGVAPPPPPDEEACGGCWGEEPLVCFGLALTPLVCSSVLLVLT